MTHIECATKIADLAGRLEAARAENAKLRAEIAQDPYVQIAWLREAVKATVETARRGEELRRARLEEADDLICRASCLDGPIGDRHLAEDAQEYRAKYIVAPSADSPPKPKCANWRRMEPDEREGLDEQEFCDFYEASELGNPCPRGYCAADPSWHKSADEPVAVRRPCGCGEMMVCDVCQGGVLTKPADSPVTGEPKCADLEFDLKEAQENIERMKTRYAEQERALCALETDRNNWKKQRVDLGIKHDLFAANHKGRGCGRRQDEPVASEPCRQATFNHTRGDSLRTPCASCVGHQSETPQGLADALGNIVMRLDEAEEAAREDAKAWSEETLTLVEKVASLLKRLDALEDIEIRLAQQEAINGHLVKEGAELAAKVETLEKAADDDMETWHTASVETNRRVTALEADAVLDRYTQQQVSEALQAKVEALQKELRDYVNERCNEAAVKFNAHLRIEHAKAAPPAPVAEPAKVARCLAPGLGPYCLEAQVGGASCLGPCEYTKPETAGPPFQFVGTCKVCGELVSDGRETHRACETKPETTGPGPHEFEPGLKHPDLCWRPTGEPNCVCGHMEKDPIHAKAAR